MPKARVQEIYASAKDTGGGLFLQGKMFDKNAAVGLLFAQDMLCQVEVAFTEQYVNPSEYYSDFQALKRSLTKVYGEPIRDEMAWTDETWKSDQTKWGTAIVYGELALDVAWETEKTGVSLACKGQDFKVDSTIIYASKELATIAAAQPDLIAGKARVYAEAAKEESVSPSTSGRSVAGLTVFEKLNEVKPPADDAEMRTRYELVKSGQKRRGKDVGSEALVAVAAEDWPAQYTPQPPGPQLVPLTTDKMAFLSNLPAMANGDITSLEEQMSKGTIFFVSNLTKVTVQNHEVVPALESTEVKVVDGPQAGKVGWVMTEWVY